jgi:uncharacterized membrane protein YdbT with pleckstrin-like domain
LGVVIGEMNRAPELAGVGFIAGLLSGVLVQVIFVKSTKYSFDQGRLAVSKGVLFKSVHNFELYRVVDLELRQTLLNRLTGDGSLVLFVEGVHGSHLAEAVTLRGLAPRRELDLIFNRLRSLVMLLRSHPFIKGIIS